MRKRGSLRTSKGECGWLGAGSSQDDWQASSGDDIDALMLLFPECAALVPDPPWHFRDNSAAAGRRRQAAGGLAQGQGSGAGSRRQQKMLARAGVVVWRRAGRALFKQRPWGGGEKPDRRWAVLCFCRRAAHNLQSPLAGRSLPLYRTQTTCIPHRLRNTTTAQQPTPLSRTLRAPFARSIPRCKSPASPALDARVRMTPPPAWLPAGPPAALMR